MASRKPDMVTLELAGVLVAAVGGATRWKGHSATGQPADALRKIDARYVCLPADLFGHRRVTAR
jgi:hypothetical protein